MDENKFQDIPPMNAMVSFDAVIKSGTIAGAAQMLNLTSSAVSQRIKQLESWFRAPLFHRNGGKLELTDIGRQLAASSTTAFDQLLATTHQIRSAAASSEITVSAISSFAYLRLMEALPDFYAASPDLSLTLDANNSKVDFRAQSLDLAIRYTYQPYDEGLVFEKIADEEIFPCVSPELLERVQSDDLKTLLDHSAMIIDSSPQLVNVQPGWQQWLSKFEDFDVEGCKSLRFNEYQYAQKTAIEGYGVLFARSVLAESAIASGELIRIGEHSMPSASSYYLVSRKDVPLKPPAREFAKWFREWFEMKEA
ncbi:Glycine cleavage system transcriptional activator [Grimontia celer]|uniref:Glycine cleavage system transcriptional activator n=1 Tax=Grimontia celer TaxID=1796497 RepID=A0A128F6Q8_9GAMM|nr:LysR substrate-binding domain-containing protein [Grimontia celer]CZF82438.1 Glycine cleavage system transcriptional activator [Grimontia celer]